MSAHMAAEECIVARLVASQDLATTVLSSAKPEDSEEHPVQAARSEAADLPNAVPSEDDLPAARPALARQRSDLMTPKASRRKLAIEQSSRMSGASSIEAASPMSARRPNMMGKKQSTTSLAAPKTMGDEMASVLVEELYESGLIELHGVAAHLVRHLEWWIKLKEPERTSPLARFVRSTPWTSLVACAIALNSVYMCIYVDRQMERYVSGEDPPTGMHAFEWAFTGFFLFDVVLKVIVHRQYFLCNTEWVWNFFDVLVIAMSLADLLLQGGSSATFMRSLRVLRVARALRVLRYMRELRRIFSSLLSSLRLMFWGVLVALFVKLLFSIAIVQSVASFFDQNGHGALPPDVEKMVIENFGSVSVTIFTLYTSMCGGNDWRTYYDPLKELGAGPEALFVMAITFLQVALLNIMTGVFVEEAVKQSIPDQEVRAMERRRADAKLADDLVTVLDNLDTNRDGYVSWDEFKQLAEESRVKALLRTMELDILDAEELFNMVTSEEEPFISIPAFCRSLMMLRGQATSIDMHALHLRLEYVFAHLEAIERHFSIQAESIARSGPPARGSEAGLAAIEASPAWWDWGDAGPNSRTSAQPPARRGAPKSAEMY